MKRILYFYSVLFSIIILAFACNTWAQQETDLQGQPIDGPRGIETLSR